MKIRRIIISVILILSILASTVVMLRLDSKEDAVEVQEAKAATYDDNGFVEYVPAADAAAAYGTKENPFTVLEIVPYAGYAEIGYLTGGKEPVDIELLCAIARSEKTSAQVSAKAAREFIDYLVTKHYLTALTEEEAILCNAKDAELPKEERKFAAYQFTEKLASDTKCYVTNANSFLRESIGLKYVSEGNSVIHGEYDIDKYEFMGWFEQGTDVRYDFSRPIFTDIDVYAKWRLTKSNGETIEPVIVTPTPDPVVPAPGYESGIMIQFAEYVPSSLGGTATIVNLPSNIWNVMTDGTAYGSALTAPETPTLSGAAGAENYILRGWYIDIAGTMPYDFGNPIPENYIRDGVMTLYPNWVLKSDCRIRFEADLPEQYAIPGNDVNWPASLSNAENGSGKELRYLQLENGTVLETEEIPEISLMGNVDYKVKQYQLDIVTVTPQDLNQGGNVGTWQLNTEASLDNLALIEKANLIMLSPQSHFYDSIMPAANVIELTENNNNKSYHKFGDEKRTAVDIWKACMNPAWFEFAEQPAEGDTGTYGFLKNDLCWEVILAIFEEVVLEEPKAALIYDAESYHMALMNGSGATSESPKKLLFGEKTSINVESLTGRNYSSLASSNNVYKLYLMMNQMSPNLFYATFLKEHIYPKMHNSISTGCYNWSENTGEVSNEVVYWNTATFLLCLLLDEADGNIWIENGVIKLKGNPWEKWGLTLDVYTLSDNLDDVTGEVTVENGLVKGNCFAYESDVVNITDYFAVNASVPYQRHVADVYDYYGNTDEITMSEILHYLVQIATGEEKDHPGAGYDKDIRVLELQPSESYLTPLTWLWNINTYIDGFQGTMSVTQQSSVEFIGKIEDLNSTYDMLYIGSDISAYVPTRTVISEELIKTYAEAEARWYDAGSTVVLAEKQKVAHKKEVEMEVTAGRTVTLEIAQMLYTSKRQHVAAGTYRIEVGQSQNLQVSKLIEPEGEKKYSDYVYQTLQNGQVVNIRVKKGDTVTLPQAQDMDVLAQDMVAAGSFTSPVAQTYRAYATSTEWMPAGSEVILAEGATLRAMVGMPAGMKLSPYSYFHTGAMVDMDLNNNIELTGSLGGNSDRVNEYYYSGNDITKVRMQEILEFAEAGYPVVVASRLMKRNAEGKLEVDTTTVDTASNMYLLLNTLAAGENDPNSVYYGNFFYEGTTSASENYGLYKQNLLSALTETKCELVVSRMPVLYADGKPVAESYINGAAGELENKKIEIAFKITDAEDAVYHLRFYIDGNADGRYDASERLVGKYDIYEVIAGRKQQVTQLKPKRNYTLAANLEDYVGVIPWKLEIVRSDNPVIRDSVIECSAILPADYEKPTLQVLHVIPDYVKDSEGNVTQCSSIYLPTTEEAAAMEWWMQCWEDVGNDRQSGWDAARKNKWNTFWNEKGLLKDNGDGTYRKWTLDEIAEHLKAHYQSWKSTGFAPEYVLDQMYVSQELSHMFMGELEDSIPYDGEGNSSDSGGRRRSSVGFWLYIRAVQDFNIEVTRYTVSEFIAETAKYKVEDNGDVSAWALEMFDMMILGFNDCYQDVQDDDALDVIEDFIAAGKQILFTHDTTSFRNYTRGSGQYSSGMYWGYNINRVFREVLGMDRFGVTRMYPLDIDGKLLDDGISIREAITRKNDAPYKTGGTQDISTEEALNENVPNTVVNGTRKYYVQGYSDLLLYRYENKRYGNPLRTKRASKVNSGQLTEYPYRVGNDITIAPTHEQYYQLDMEAEDIVVWYTLEGTPQNYYTSAADYAGTYHDVRNNYYLYSRGNIIYTGVGHDSYLTKDELKLFVNTFVASYRVPADPPTIEVQNSNATTADTEYFYIDFDSWDDMTAVGTEVITDAVSGEQFQRVRFVVKETVPLKNQKLSMEYYLADASLTGASLTELTDVPGERKQSGYYVSADAEGNPEEITLNGAKLQICRASDGSVQTTLLTDTEYFVDIPLHLMNGKDGAELLFRACINYGRRNDQYVYAYQKIRFLRRGLYDLD